MAFVPPTSNAASAQQPAAATARAANQPKTTLAYVNFYLPLKDETRIKLFSDLTLRLYAERPAEAKLIDLIKSGQLTMEQVVNAIQAEISLARDENAEIEFDI